MKTSVIKILSAAWIICIFNILQASTITSTLNGGPWNEATTWIEGVVPGSNDTAIVQGPVIIGSVVVYEIFHSYGGWVIVEQSGSLVPHEYGGGLGTFHLYVEHDITNNGIIYNGEEYLHLLIKGNIMNNGIWEPHETFLSGTTNQNISLGEGAVFGGFWTLNNPVSITALSDIRYNGGYSHGTNYYIGDFNLNGKTLHLGAFSINIAGTVIFNGTIEGDFEILGTFNVDKDLSDTLVFQGTVHVTDTLQNTLYGGGYGIMKLVVEGDIINNGVIRDHPMDDDLSILITGNIFNNGIWSCNHVSFTGSENQYLEQTAGKYFESNLYDLDATSQIIANSDITVNQEIQLNGSVLDLQGHTLNLTSWLKNGILKNANLQGGYLLSVHAAEYINIYGLVTLDDYNVFQCPVIVYDTLRCNTYGGGSYYYEFQIDGSLINNGYIQSYGSGMLRMHITGDLVNNGSWASYTTYLEGDADQHISQSNEQAFGGDFEIQKVNGNAIADSDLRFLGNVNLNGSTLKMEGYTIYMNHFLYNGILDQAVLHGGLLQSINATSKLDIKGTVKLDDYDTINCPLTVYDTLQSNTYGGGSKYYDVTINNSVTNFGVIQSWGSGILRLYITGNLYNSGQWVNYLTYLNGTEDQHIYLFEDITINGNVQFDAVKTTAPFQWYHDGLLLDSPDFNGETAQVLSWNVPVQSVWYGTFYSETGEGNSRNIIVGRGMYSATNLTAEVNCTDVELTWEMPNGSPDSWNIYRNNELFENVSSMYYTDEMLNPGEEYSYYVTAVFGTEESEPTATATIYLDIPANTVPGNFVTEPNETEVFCTWDKPACCLLPDGYNIYRNGEKINSTPISETTFTDSPGSGNFSYEVTAVYYFGESDHSETSTVHISGIEEINLKYISLYPNPAKGKINITSDIEIYKLHIFDSQGQQVKDRAHADKNCSLDISNFKPGIYLLILDTEKGKLQSRFVVK
jgi:hypothetical protein